MKSTTNYAHANVWDFCVSELFNEISFSANIGIKKFSEDMVIIFETKDKCYAVKDIKARFVGELYGNFYSKDKNNLIELNQQELRDLKLKFYLNDRYS